MPVDAPNPYAAAQLARALAAAEAHPDPAARARAADHAARWSAVIDGMSRGALLIGRRAPLRNTPAWITAEVVTGGFATGRLQAEGPLRPHEAPLLAALDPTATDAAADPAATRARLAAACLAPAGLAWLRERLATGRYRVDVPEEGALLALVWLLDAGHDADARALLDALAPWLPRLRFYPIPADRPLDDAATVRRCDVRAVREALAAYAPPRPVQRLYAAVHDAAPLLDSFVALWAETLDGPRPRREAGHLTGGWPGRRVAPDWSDRAREALAAFDALLARGPALRRLRRPGANLPTLAAAARLLIDGRLTGRAAGQVRAVLADVDAARGLPGDARHAVARAAQRAQARAPLHDGFARALDARLAPLPLDGGIPALAPFLTDDPPAHLARRLRPALDAPLAAHVAQGTLPSGEAIARALPPLSARAAAAGIDDPALRRLYVALYAAFRRRRSLLLTDLQSQVRFGELPWVAALDAHRPPAPAAARAAARALLAEVTTVTLEAFPHAILPNKLLTEFAALARAAGLAVPLTEELAADIYTGELTEKHLAAARVAAELVEGTLYARYFTIDTAAIREMTLDGRAHGRETARALARLCRERRPDLQTRASPVVRNGAEIEQLQILTTHNLASLFAIPGLLDPLRPRLPALALRTLDHVIDALAHLPADWRPRLKRVKDAAYAWRQMVFWLALSPPATHPAVIERARERLAADRALARRFEPALRGLADAIAGQPPEAAGGRVFFGWTAGPHFLLPPRAAAL